MCVAMCVVVSAVLVGMMLVLLCAVRCCRSHTPVLPERDDDAVEFVYKLYTPHFQTPACDMFFRALNATSCAEPKQSRPHSAR